MDSILVNPFSIWLRYLLKKWYLEFKFRKQHLRLGYLSDVQQCTFGQYNTIYKHARLLKTHLDDFTYVAKNSQISWARIGKFCSIGPNVLISPGRHPADQVSTHPAFFSLRKQAQITFAKESSFTEFIPVEIGNDVWIGANALIMDGVKIGNGAIIGAHAVVTKDIPPYAVALGIPAKVVRYRFNEEDIAFMLSIQWWNKGPEWISRHQPYFKNIAEFRKAVALQG